eukprot:maker-scaffold_29-snap-gene-0.51-mRNA-1 protein AED:0.02 eAED:0.02 QI:139/1/1/1/1/1/3/947/221
MQQVELNSPGPSFSYTGDIEETPAQENQESFAADSRVQLLVATAKEYFKNSPVQNPFSGVNDKGQLLKEVNKEFFNCADVRQYGIPENREVMFTRVRSNLSNFRLMYGVTVLFFFCYFLLTSPFLLTCLLLTVALWTYLFQFKKPDEVVQIAGYSLGQKEKYAVMLPLTGFVVLFGGLLNYFLYVAFTSSIVIFAHGALRKEIEVDPLSELADLSDGENFV